MRTTEDMLGEAFYLAWDCQGDPAGSGRRWEDLPEAGRARFIALARDLARRLRAITDAHQARG